MKNFLHTLFLLIFVSCSVTDPQHYPRYIHFSVFDFTPFTEQNFLFTPEKYDSKYESIGLITCVIVPEEELKSSQKDEQKNRLDDIYAEGPMSTNTMMWVTEEIKPEEILQIIYDECIKMGADAFVNFEYQTIQMPSRNIAFIREIEYHIVNGFAIKRLD